MENTKHKIEKTNNARQYHKQYIVDQLLSSGNRPPDPTLPFNSTGQRQLVKSPWFNITLLATISTANTKIINCFHDQYISCTSWHTNECQVSWDHHKTKPLSIKMPVSSPTEGHCMLKPGQTTTRIYSVRFHRVYPTRKTKSQRFESFRIIYSM